MAGYLGNIPTAVPLTSADIADGIISSAKIADGTIVNADINASAGIVTSKLSGALGITEADQWRLSTSYSYSGSQSYATLTSNWERVDTDGFGLLGTGMTQSSGVFTFPSTGIYLVTFTAHAETSTNNARFVGASIFTTTDGSTFGESGQYAGNALASTMGNGTRTTVTGQFQFDVTNVTTHKVRFEVTSNQNTTSYLGDTSGNYTCVGFIRLGDT
jgi:hypothetical protein